MDLSAGIRNLESFHLKKMTIPFTVKGIEYYTFARCEKLLMVFFKEVNLILGKMYF